MRVAMYYSNNDVRLEEQPKPEIGKGELLVKIKSSGICGTDVMEWYRIHRVPLVLGHEISGEVVEVGEGISKYKKGDRVCAAHHVPCGSCRYCLKGHETVCETLRKTSFDPGGFSEYVRLPAINVEKGVFLLPDAVSFEEATFIEPLACVLRGQKTAKLGQGDTVLIIGSGISGALHIALARAMGSAQGAVRIIATDVVDYRLKMAREFGAQFVINAKDDVAAEVKKINGGRGADVVILCTGAEGAMKQAFESVDKGGIILFFAATAKDVTIPLSVNDVFWRNEITLTSSYAGSPNDHFEALNLISSWKVDVKRMITHRFGLKDAGAGFKLVAEAKDSLKVIIDPQK